MPHIYHALLAMTVLFGFVAGGVPERWAALIILCNYVLWRLGLSIEAVRWDHFELFAFAADLAMWLALLALAMKAQRFWPIWMAALAGAQALTHFLGLAGIYRLKLVYALLAQFWCYPIDLLLIGATLAQLVYRLKANEVALPTFSPDKAA